MAIGYDGGAYSGNLDEISLALGVDPDIEGVTSRKGTPVDKVLGLDDFLRDLMSGRTYQAGKGLLGQGDMEDPLLQQISLTGNEQGDTIHLGMRMGETYDDFLERTMAQKNFEETLESITPTISKSLVKDAQDKLSKIYDKDYTLKEIRDRIQNIRDDVLSGTQSFEVETPLGTTDIFDPETGEWTALTDTEKLMRGLDDEEVTVTELPWVDDEKTEEEKINSLINQLNRPKVKEAQAWRESADSELRKAIALQEETAVLDLEEEEEDESVFQKVIAETLGLPVDTVNAVISSILRAAGAPDKVVENPVGGRAWLMANKGMTIDDVVAQVADMLSPTTSSGVMDSWPSIPTVQDTQADVMDEGYLDGLNMTAEESRALTRELNTLGRPRLDHEIEALKRGALINQQTQQNLEDLEESKFVDEGFLEGLSPAMRNVLNNDPELLAQYMAARSSIIAQLDKTKFQHEDWYPGSQAAATQAGFWGPKALGWNDKYNEYKDAQRELMGLQSGQRFWSDDWINNLGWMSPEQINRISGYGEP
tara:strand:+ start:57 stop:1667 length:1611 start_codon:yes stop_codon:yes gene_type:complete